MRYGLAVLLIALALPAHAGPPQRVVSMNLCTDQLAMLLAAPGQLISVSDWATRPSASNMAEEAAQLEVNGGSAEQIFLMQPDLVLAGTFTNRVTVDMLRRLGVRVETVRPARSLAAVSGTLREVGRLLGREEKAEALVTELEATLAAASSGAGDGPRMAAAYYYPNNYTAGADTLAAEVMERAGFDNAAADLGLVGAARIDLETLVMTRPFLIRTEPISGNRTGRSYETASHPALAALGADGRSAMVADRWQVCGTPFVVRAVAALAEARRAADRRPAGETE
jgi:iron complex transport system substrate-binding protein